MSRAFTLLCGLTLAFLAWASPGMAGALPEPGAESSDLPRHELERRALTEPEIVLGLIESAVAAARQANDHHELALLALARANACRVIADWPCQRDAGAEGVREAEAAGHPVLLVRSLIAEARAHIALQDFSRGERLLGRAELELEHSPNAELSADIQLAFSSLSFALGKHELSSKYAQRGLAVLAPGQALPLQVRLLRNQARGLAHTNRTSEARTLLEAAIVAADQFVDPKLTAELSLEIARLARRDGDLAAQRLHGKKVLELGADLTNSQLEGLGHEVLGLAATDAGELALAQAELELARQAFAGLGLTRDEARSTRELLEVMLDRGQGQDRLNALTRRVLELGGEVADNDRAQAADAFDARLEYARQQLEVVQLEAAATLAAEQANALAQRIRLNRRVGLLGAVILIVLAISIWQQRRAHRRLLATMTALQESDARATDLLELSTGYLFLHDPEGVLKMLNPAAATALGGTTKSLLGIRLQDFAPPEDTEAWSSYLEALNTTGRAEGTLQIQPPGGEIRSWRYTSRCSPADVVMRYIIGQAVDVTAEVRRSEALRQASLFDALTHCYNRRYLHEFEHDHLGDHSWGVVYFDLDGFKQINDTHGHEEGDRILVGFAEFLRDRVRTDDAVVRIGGDEFVVLLARADAAAVAGQVERLQRDSELAPTAFSMGHAVRSGPESLSETLARADAAMYQSRGRDVQRGDTWDPARSEN